MTRIVSRLGNKWIGSVGDNNETLRRKTEGEGGGSLCLREEIGENQGYALFLRFSRIYVNVRTRCWGEFFCEINILQGKMEIFFFFYDEQNYRKLADLSVLLLFISLNVSVEISKRYFAKKLKILEMVWDNWKYNWKQL